MFLYLIACFDSPESSSDVAQLQQDVSALKSLLETQNSKIHALEEDYSLLLAEYNSLMEMTQNQQAEQQSLDATMIAFQNEYDAFFTAQESLNTVYTTEQEALWTEILTTQESLPTVEMITMETTGDYTQQVTQFYFYLPTAKILGILPMIVQGKHCSMQYGTTNWGTSYGMWQWDGGEYHKAIDEFVLEPGFVLNASPERWPWIILDCASYGGGAAYSIDFWVVYQ